MSLWRSVVLYMKGDRGELTTWGALPPSHHNSSFIVAFALVLPSGKGNIRGGACRVVRKWLGWDRVCNYNCQSGLHSWWGWTKDQRRSEDVTVLRIQWYVDGMSWNSEGRMTKKTRKDRVHTQSSGLLANAILCNQFSNFASLYLSSLVSSGTEEMMDEYS